MFFFIWDYMAQRIDMKKDIYKWLVKKKDKKRSNMIKESRHNILPQITLYFLKIQLFILKSLQNNDVGLLLSMALAEIMAPHIY